MRLKNGKPLLHGMLFGVLCCFCLCAFASDNHSTSSSLPPVRLAVVNTFGNNFSVRLFNGTVNAIAKAIQPRRLQIELYNQDKYLEAAKRNEFDLSIASSGLTAVIMDDLGATPLLTLVHDRTPDPNRSTGGVIVTRADRDDIQDLKDLKDKSLVVMSKKAFAGYMIPRDEIRKNGFDPDRLFSHTTELRAPSTDLVDKVKSGQYDVGFLATCVLENLESDGVLQPGEIKVIHSQNSENFYCKHSTDLYPGWYLSARCTLPSSDLRKIVLSLLDLPVGKETGDYWTISNDNQLLNKLLNRMERFHQKDGLLWFFKRYKNYILAGALLLVLFFLNWLYLARAVRTRTRKLKETLEENLNFERENHRIQDRYESLQRVNSIALVSGMVAHELKQPLGAINNFAEGIGRRINKGSVSDPRSLLPVIDEIKSAAERASAILEMVRKFGKKGANSRKRLNLGEVTEKIVSSLVRLGKMSKDYEIDCEEDVIIEGDRLNIEVALLNLIKNGVEACSVSAHPLLRISVKKVADQAQVIIEDNGPELSDEAFQRLTEVGNSTKKEGLGLGIGIAHQLLEAHGGSLKLARRRGGGLRCEISLPLFPKPAKTSECNPLGAIK